ncbi:MAG: hypothetical protein AABZ60_07675 [Planctomycetota bacterium]
MKKKLVYGFLSLLLLGTFGPLTPVLAQDNAHRSAASEAARLRAVRNLTEELFGVWLISESEVEDFQLKKDIVLAKTQGQLPTVSFSKVVEDRKNGLLRVKAAISRADALVALEKSGYKGGGELRDPIEAEGEAEYSGPWGSGNTSVRTNYERDLSLSTCMTFLLFNELSLTPPSDLTQWTALVKEVDANVATAISRDSEGRVRLDMKLKREHINDVLKRAEEENVIDSAERKEAEEKVVRLFDKGMLGSCLFKEDRVIKASNGEPRWYPVYLNPNIDMACALTELIFKLPTGLELSSEVTRHSNLKFTYSEEGKKLKLELSLDKADVPFALKNIDSSESSQIIPRVGKGIKLAVEVYGR